MPLRNSNYIQLISITGDYVLLNVYFVVGFIFTADIPVSDSNYILFYIYLNFIWSVLITFFGAFRINRNTSKKAIFITYTQILIFFFFAFLMYFQLIPLSYYDRSFIKLLFPLFFFSLLVWKFSLYYAFIIYRKRGFNYRNVLIIGYNQRSLSLYNYFKSNIWIGYRCAGIVNSGSINFAHKIGQLEDVSEIININKIDEVFIALDCLDEKEKSDLIKVLNQYPVKVRLIPDMGNFSFHSSEIVNFGYMPVIVAHTGPLSYWYNQLIKRIFDLIISSIVIVSILSWLTILLFFINLFFDRKGVFFLQKRTSINGKPFTIIKFRSMVISDDANIKKARHNDERVTKIGKFLRQSSLDELPQFINVFKGQMSIIGPRPHMLKHTEQYSKIVEGFLLRHSVKPGITGLAQINGYRGEVKKISDIQKRVELDVQYIEKWTFNLDIKIILLTIWVLLKGQKEAY